MDKNKMKNPIHPPSLALENARLKYKIREARCEHIEKDLRILLLNSDGYIEYCINCMKVTDLYEPS